MKLIVAGGRDYQGTYEDFNALAEYIKTHNVTEIVSGGCRGADQIGEIVADLLNIPVKQFLPDWKSYGKAAGPMRNKQMAEYADAVYLFPGGAGTRSMEKIAREANIPIIFAFIYSAGIQK